MLYPPSHPAPPPLPLPHQSPRTLAQAGLPGGGRAGGAGGQAAAPSTLSGGSGLQGRGRQQDGTQRDTGVHTWPRAPSDGAYVVLLGLLAVLASLFPLLLMLNPGTGEQARAELQSAEGSGQGTCSARCGDIMTRLRELHRQREA